MGAEQEIEFKNIIQAVVQKLIKLFSVDSNKIDRFVRTEYSEGINEAEEMFQMNFIPEGDVSFLSDYVNNNVESITDDIGNNLRGELSRGILNGDDAKKLKKRIKTVFNDKNYTNRLKTVFRTEGIRARNTGQLDGAKQTGLNIKKYLDVSMTGDTSEICLAMNEKYGDEEDAIPLDDNFKVTVQVGNKTISVDEQIPPFHPNCRTTVKYKRIKEE